MVKVILKHKRERSLLRRHPWLFSGAIASVEGMPRPGETVEVCLQDGTILARGAYSPSSQIRIRIWTFDPSEEVGPALLRNRIERALAGRKALEQNGDLTAYRLIHAESDGLPGLIVDRYAGFLVCQFLAASVEYWKTEIVQHLAALVKPEGIYERSDDAVRLKEGLSPTKGTLFGKDPPRPLEICEGSWRFLVDLVEGQKTGFFLDQRENRICLARYAAGAEALNAFAYTGGFAVAALKGGASHVTNVDSSSAALVLARQNLALNSIEPDKGEHIEGDVFTVLRGFRDRRRSFDLIVLDPPKFADTVGHLMRATRAYKDINLLAIKLLRPGGILFSFSCSGLMTPDLFQKIVADAALDAHRDVQILEWLRQGPDHPVLVSFPEGAYLKGLVCRVW